MGKQSHTLHGCLSLDGELLGPCPMLRSEGAVISSKPSPLCLIPLPCCCKTKLYLIVFGCAENNKKAKSKATDCCHAEAQAGNRDFSPWGSIGTTR